MFSSNRRSCYVRSIASCPETNDSLTGRRRSMKVPTSRWLVCLPILVALPAAQLHGETCYEFTGQTEGCQQMFPTWCETPGECVWANHPVNDWVCLSFEIDPELPAPTWDGFREETEGYGADGGENIVCFTSTDCTCEAQMEGNPVCVIRPGSAIQHFVPVPNIDINTPCPQVYVP